MIPFLLGSVLVSLTVGKPQNRTRTAHWPTKAGKCEDIASAIKKKGLTDEVFVSCDLPESVCTFSCRNDRKPVIRQTRCICKIGESRKGRIVNKGCQWTRQTKWAKNFCTVKEMSRLSRKDDMVFGKWQANMMLEKGQTTEGLRVDNKIDVNPMFADFLGPSSRSGAGGEEPAKGLESRLDLGRAIGAVIKWDRYREGNQYVIPYFYQEGYSTELRTDIERALTDLGDNTCIDFRIVDENNSKYANKIKIVAGSGCYSYVGFQGVPHQSISLREVGCLSRGTVQHEFMHALGFYHEQARPDAKDYVQVKYQNVGKMCGSSGHESCESQFDQLPLHEWEDSREGGKYDIGSVMHYGGYDFSENGEATLLDITSQRPIRDQRLRFSQSDAEQICEIYQCDALGHTCMGGRWQCADGNGHTFANKVCDGLVDCADGSDEDGCIEKTCCDKIHIDGLTFLMQPDRTMNSKPFYELEGDGEDVYLYYYHDGKKNRYWLISKYINVLSVFGYSFEEMLCPQEMHIRSSLGGNWKWAWAQCAHEPKFGEWSAWSECGAMSNGANAKCQSRRIRHCKGGQVGYHAGCPKGKNVESKPCSCGKAQQATKVDLSSTAQVGADGKWTSWGPWASCSRTCGHGERQRVRSCQGGVIGAGDCMFDSWKDTEICNDGSCPGWGTWGHWSGCDATCDSGEQVRTRQCNGARVGTQACPMRGRQEAQPCGGLPCPKWASWSPWSPCSASCDEGQSARVRGCLFAELGDPGCPIVNSKESQMCINKQCNSNNWTLWGRWTECTASCGGGLQVRHRDCTSKNMKLCPHETAVDNQECNTERCDAVVASWSRWETWSSCSATCGGGDRTRSRTCVNGQSGDVGCLNAKSQDSQICNNEACQSEEGCLVDPAYQYSMCRIAKKITKGAEGYYPDGTTCNQIRCSKQFYGFVWKGRTQKTTCTCSNGTCGWTKPFHKCPIGCAFPPEWSGERCVKAMDPKTIKLFSSSEELYYTPKAGKCRQISCANDLSEFVMMPKCNCDLSTAQCEWNKSPSC